MAKLQFRSISRRTVDALTVEKETFFWDRNLSGFGVRVYPTGAKVYVVQTRRPNGSKRITLGRHGVITADQARRRAVAEIARIKFDDAPEPMPKSTEAHTVAELAERYLREHVEVRCKPRTVKHYRSAIDKHILPAFGDMPITAVTAALVADLHYDLRERPYTANLAIDTLSQIIKQAAAWSLAPEGFNPCQQVPRYREGRRERFLTDVEIRRLGRVLEELQAEGRLPVHAAAAIRLLVLTGCRRNEIVRLRWDDVDFEAGELQLRDSKTGPRSVSLSPEAVEVLAAIPRVRGNRWVIAGHDPSQPMLSLSDHWRRVRSRADLKDVRLHDLRHTFASRALALGESLPVIAKLLGHSQVKSTARYVHLAQDTVKEAAARVAAVIEADILPADLGQDAVPAQHGSNVMS